MEDGGSFTERNHVIMFKKLISIPAKLSCLLRPASLNATYLVLRNASHKG